jgi:hypothetical protein
VGWAIDVLHPRATRAATTPFTRGRPTDPRPRSGPGP